MSEDAPKKHEANGDCVKHTRNDCPLCGKAPTKERTAMLDDHADALAKVPPKK